MSPDPFARAQAESDNQRIAFIRGELAMCFTFTVLATMNYEAGNRDSAEQSKGVAEGAGALSVAAALTGRTGQGPIVAIVSGGNIDLKKFAERTAKVVQKHLALAKETQGKLQ